MAIKLRRDTAANWTSANPILAQGEEGLETDTNNRKVGDGTTTWDLLAYWPPAGAGDLLAANNLSDLDNIATARTNLGLGSLATQSGTFSGISSGTNTGDQTLNGLLPSQTGNAGKVLETDGSNASWQSAGGGATWGAITGTLSAQTDLQSALNLKADLASPTFTGTVSGITSSMVGLGNVDNTSDVNKPVSTAQASAIALKLSIANNLSDVASASTSRTNLGIDLTALKTAQFSITVGAPTSSLNIPILIARTGLTIIDVACQTDSGTVTCAFKINTTNITSLSAVAVSSTQATSTATAANVMVAGDVLRVLHSSASAPVNAIYTFTALLP